jgi:hypothetical protein
MDTETDKPALDLPPLPPGEDDEPEAEPMDTFVVSKEHRRLTEFADAVLRDRYIGLCYGATRRRQIPLGTPLRELARPPAVTASVPPPLHRRPRPRLAHHRLHPIMNATPRMIDKEEGQSSHSVFLPDGQWFSLHAFSRGNS